jgi:phosphate acetyltransferase
VAKVRDTAAKHSLNIAGYEIVDAPHSDAAAAKAVEMIHAGKGEALMKGSLHTDELMRSVTAKVGGLRTDRRISHVFIMDVPAYADTVFVTDAAINIFPDHPKRRRSIQSGWLRHDAAGRDPVRGRNSYLQDTLDYRSRRAVQDG